MLARTNLARARSATATDALATTVTAVMIAQAVNTVSFPLVVLSLLML
jgi:hypothetical protein